MDLLFSLYKFLMPLVYIAAGIYLLVFSGPAVREFHTLMSVVILLYGLYRLIRHYNFFGKNDDHDRE